jgi:addiction module RelE/StbE family toxin
VTQVIWAPQAIQDVEAIRAHVARDSVHYADLVVERIVAAVERLVDHPRSGRIVPELGDVSIREVIHGNYRIVYRLRQDIVEIATVFHGARLFRLDSAR